MSSISVLLLDDNERWARGIADLVEKSSAGEIEVAIETEVEPFLEAAEPRRYDCLVVDHVLPGTTGLDMFRELRGRGVDAPFILITGKGSERVASEALSAGVDDYVIKDPSGETVDTLTNRILNAVERRRAERELEMKRERLLSVVRNLPQPVAVTRGGEVVDSNPAYDEVFGPGGPEFGDTFRGASGTNYRVSRGEDGDRFYEVERINLGEEICEVLHDRTEAVETHLALEEELELRDAALEALHRSRSREEVERAFCDHLSGVKGFDSVLTAAPSGDGGVALRASSGDPERVPPRALELAEAAVRSRGTETTGEDPVRGVAVPLEYRDVLYGALVAVDDTGIDPTDRDDVEEMALTLSYSVRTEEVSRALEARRRITVGITMGRWDDWMHRLAAEADGPVEVKGALSRPSGDHLVIMEAPRDVETGGIGVDVEDAYQEGDRLRIEAVTGTELPLTRLKDLGVLVREFRVTPEGADIRGVASSHRSLGTILSEFRQRYPSAELTELHEEYPEPGSRDDSPLSDLTERQREILEMAYLSGYFDVPRRKDGSELSRKTGLSRPTWNEHLRKSLRTIMSNLLGDD